MRYIIQKDIKFKYENSYDAFFICIYYSNRNYFNKFNGKMYDNLKILYNRIDNPIITTKSYINTCLKILPFKTTLDNIYPWNYNSIKRKYCIIMD